MPTNRVFLKRLKNLGVDQSGAIAAYAAIGMVVFLGFAALALDIGHMVSVKSEMQKAADAGALAGARALYLTAPAPNWANGATVGAETVQKNRVDGSLLTNCTVLPGYWDLTWSPSQKAAADLKSTGIVPGPKDVAAVKVRVEKSSGNNGGPVQIFLASVLGVLPADASATSVAMISFPTGMKAGGLKPMVATKDIVKNYWDQFDPLNPDKPFKFKIGDGSDANDTMWSTFKVDSNSNDYTKELILNGNPDPIYIGDSVYLQPGVRAVDYGPSEMGKFINQTIVLPIVDPVTLLAKTTAPILGFVAFHITGYSQGEKYIEGYFDKDYVIANPQGAGSPNPNVSSTSNPPQLVY